jgi:ATP-grasp domain
VCSRDTPGTFTGVIAAHHGVPVPDAPRRTVYVLGLDDHHLARLRDLPDADRYDFCPLLSGDELQPRGDIPVEDLLRRAGEELAAAEPPPDAVIGFWDFPVSTMVPILAGDRGLRSASLESVLRCEHKYWCRLEQEQVIDEHPAFGLVDLEDGDHPPEGLRYPMWVKPVKAFSSDLAFAVHDDDSFRAAVDKVRAGIHRVGDPFDRILRRVPLPPEIDAAGGAACLAEETVTGRQLTVEGYVHDGEVVHYGVIASVQHAELPTIERYQYPATLPDEVRARLFDVTRRLIARVGLDGTTFNVEYFWDEGTGALEVLEVNPRHSASHADLLEMVDGTTNHQAMVRLALGEDPELQQGAGLHGVAAKCYLLHTTDGVVRRVPDADEIDRVCADIPGAEVELHVRVGDRLSELPGQDSYAYKLADVQVGAADEDELLGLFDRARSALSFEVVDA